MTPDRILPQITNNSIKYFDSSYNLPTFKFSIFYTLFMEYSIYE